jgi:hypothetical protein
MALVQPRADTAHARNPPQWRCDAVDRAVRQEKWIAAVRGRLVRAGLSVVWFPAQWLGGLVRRGRCWSAVGPRRRSPRRPAVVRPVHRSALSAASHERSAGTRGSSCGQGGGRRAGKTCPPGPRRPGAHTQRARQAPGVGGGVSTGRWRPGDPTPLSPFLSPRKPLAEDLLPDGAYAYLSNRR